MSSLSTVLDDRLQRRIPSVRQIRLQDQRQHKSIPFCKSNILDLTNNNSFDSFCAGSITATSSFDHHLSRTQESININATLDNGCDSDLANCTKCGFQFCIKCFCPFHLNRRCERDNDQIYEEDEDQGQHNNYKQSKRNLRRLCSLDT